MPVGCWKLGGNGFEYWSKWLFTSCKLNKFKKVNISFSSQPYVGWERSKRREMKVMLSVWQPHRGTGCSSASPWLPGQGTPAFPLWKNCFPAQAQCENPRSGWVAGSTCSAKGLKAVEVGMQSAGGVCQAQGAAPAQPQCCRAITGAGTGSTLLLSCLGPALQPADITEFSSWIVLFLLFSPVVVVRAMTIYWWIHWSEPSQGLLRFCCSLNVLLKYSCAVWRLWDLTAGEAE